MITDKKIDLLLRLRDDATSKLKRAGINIKNFVKETEKARKQMSQGWSNLGRTFVGVERILSRTVRRTMAGITGIIGGVTFSSVLQARIEEEFSKAWAMANWTPALKKAGYEQARILAESIGTPLQESAKMYFQLGSAGLKAPEQLKAIPEVAKLTRISFMDSGIVVDALTDSLSAFGKSVAVAGKYSDIITKTWSSANTTFEQLVEALSYSVGPAAMLGLNFKQLNTLIAAFANVGQKGSRAGMQIATGLIRLAAPQKKAAEWLDYMNVNWKAFAAKKQDVITTLKQIAEGIKKIPAERRVEALQDIFGIRAIRGFAPIVRDINNNLLSFVDTINQYSGATEKALKEITQGWSGASRELRTTAQAFRDELFRDALERGLTVVVNKVQGDLKKIRSWVKETKIGELLGDEFKVAMESLTKNFDVLGWIKKNIGATPDEVKKTIESWKERFKQFKSWFTEEFWRPLKNTLKEIFKNLFPEASSEDAWKSIQKVLQSVGKTINALATGVERLSSVWAKLPPGLQKGLLITSVGGAALKKTGIAEIGIGAWGITAALKTLFGRVRKVAGVAGAAGAGEAAGAAGETAKATSLARVIVSKIIASGRNIGASIAGGLSASSGLLAIPLAEAVATIIAGKRFERQTGEAVQEVRRKAMLPDFGYIKAQMRIANRLLEEAISAKGKIDVAKSDERQLEEIKAVKEKLERIVSTLKEAGQAPAKKLEKMIGQLDTLIKTHEEGLKYMNLSYDQLKEAWTKIQSKPEAKVAEAPKISFIQVAGKYGVHAPGMQGFMEVSREEFLRLQDIVTQEWKAWAERQREDVVSREAKNREILDALLGVNRTQEELKSKQEEADIKMVSLLETAVQIINGHKNFLTGFNEKLTNIERELLRQKQQLEDMELAGAS